MLQLQNAILRERDPAPPRGAAARAKPGKKDANKDDVRQALRLPETSAWVSASATSKAEAASRDATSRIATDTAEGSSAERVSESESKGLSRLLASVMSEVVGEEGALPQNSSMVVTIGVDGVDVQRGPMKTILQSQLDWEVSSFREQVIM